MGQNIAEVTMAYSDLIWSGSCILQGIEQAFGSWLVKVNLFIFGKISLVCITGNALQKALLRINREDIVNDCMYNRVLVTDDLEKAVAKVQLDQSGFDALKEELGPSRDQSMKRETSIEVSFDEQDMMRVRSYSLLEIFSLSLSLRPGIDLQKHFFAGSRIG